jgi:hypothetical protein
MSCASLGCSVLLIDETLQKRIMNNDQEIDRRKFIKVTAATAAGAAVTVGIPGQPVGAKEIAFSAVDSLYHGPGWETLNPGFWQIKEH